MLDELCGGSVNRSIDKKLTPCGTVMYKHTRKPVIACGWTHRRRSQFVSLKLRMIVWFENFLYRGKNGLSNNYVIDELIIKSILIGRTHFEWLNNTKCAIRVEEKGEFWDTDPSTLDPSTLRGMSGQVLRVKGYYEVMIHKHHCEDVYDLIDLCYFFISILED